MEIKTALNHSRELHFISLLLLLVTFCHEAKSNQKIQERKKLQPAVPSRTPLFFQATAYGVNDLFNGQRPRSSNSFALSNSLNSNNHLSYLSWLLPPIRDL
jgi:hypothetical protein